MWDCLKCGVQRIAASILRCPTCREERNDMPKSTTGGASNAKALPGETGYVEPDVAEAAPVKPAVDGTKAPEPAKPAPAVTAPQPAAVKPAAPAAPAAAVDPAPAKAAPDAAPVAAAPAAAKATPAKAADEPAGT